MKNVIKVLSLALVMVMMLGLFVSCGPNKDPKKAEEALNDAGYLVVLNDKDLLLPDGVKATLLATTDDDYILITYYEDADAVKEAWEDAQEEAKELEKKYEDIVCKKSGKMIYIGTKQAVKDAR